MSRSRGLLVLLAVALLFSAGGLTTFTPGAGEPGSTEIASAPASVTADLSDAVCDGNQQPFEAAGAERVPPDCCAPQCTVDRDCNKICGKGNCACVQVTSCCRRCVY